MKWYRHTCREIGDLIYIYIQYNIHFTLDYVMEGWLCCVHAFKLNYLNYSVFRQWQLRIIIILFCLLLLLLLFLLLLLLLLLHIKFSVVTFLCIIVV